MKNRSITDVQVYEVDIVCDLSQKALDVLEEYLSAHLHFRLWISWASRMMKHSQKVDV